MIRIDGTDDDPTVLGGLAVELDEMAAIVGDDRPPICMGEREHEVVGNLLPGLSCLLDSRDIVPKFS